MQAIAVFSIALIFMALGAGLALRIVSRRLALGDELLDACAGSHEVAAQAIESIRGEHELLVDAVVAAYTKGDK